MISAQCYVIFKPSTAYTTELDMVKRKSRGGPRYNAHAAIHSHIEYSPKTNNDIKQ